MFNLVWDYGSRKGEEYAEYALSKTNKIELGWSIGNGRSWLAKNSFVFFCKMALVVLVVFNFIQNNFVKLYCDSCHISMHLRESYQNR